MARKCKRRPGGGGAASVLLTGELPQHSAGRSEIEELLHGLEGKQLRYFVEPRRAAEALLDARLGPSALNLIVEAAHSVVTGGEIGCACCAQPWRADRLIAGFALAAFVDTLVGDGVLAAVCGACWLGPDLPSAMASAF